MARTNKRLAQNNKTNLLAPMYIDPRWQQVLPNGGCDGPQPFILKEGNPLMLKQYVETVKRLGTDKDGVVSLEYVIVAACVCAVVIAVFNTGGSLPGALTSGFSKITAALAKLVIS